MPVGQRLVAQMTNGSPSLPGISYLRAQQGKLVILDEIHRAPGVFEVLRGIIDDNRQAGLRSGQFLLLGSAALDLMRQSSETLAGRVAYLDMAPINVGEAAAAGIADSTLWLRGGFPDSLLAPDDTQSLDWRRDFIRSYQERDVPMFAPRLPVETIGDGGNLGKRLVKSPKVYVRDSGLLHGLLELETLNALLGHPVCGLSFEGHCIENLIQAAGNRRVPYFYRTQVGAEIDLVLEQGGKPEIAIEVKRSMARRRLACRSWWRCWRMTRKIRR